MMKAKLSNLSSLKLGLILLLFTFSFMSCLEDFGSDYRNNDVAVEADFDYQFDVTGPGNLLLDGLNGNVEIIGITNSSEIIVYGTRRVESNSRSDAEWFLDRVNVQIIIENEQLTVRTDQPIDTDGRNVNVNYFVRLPRDWFVEVENNNGEVSISQMNESVNVDVDNGEIDMAFINGNIDADLTNGNIYLNDLRGNVNTDLTNGNIFADLMLLPGGILDMEVINGQVNLTIPSTTSAQLRAEVTNGGISASGLPLQNTQSTPKSLRGRLGSGNGTINLETVNGSISIVGQ